MQTGRLEKSWINRIWQGRRIRKSWVVPALMVAGLGLGAPAMAQYTRNVAQTVPGPQKPPVVKPPATTPPPADKPKTPAPPAVKKPTPPQGSTLKVSKFIFKYDEKLKTIPPMEKTIPIASLGQIEIGLGLAPNGYVGPDQGHPPVTKKLSELGKVNQAFYDTAIKAVIAQVVDHFNRQGIVAVFAMVDEQDITPDGQDVRPMGKTELHVRLFAGYVGETRTLAAGGRFDPEERTNNPAHRRILANSPLQAKPTAGSTNLVNKDQLDDYLFRLNRHPGRRVDAAMSTGVQEGSVALDYMVTENKPWMVYFQASNTGTETTDKWRERFGFMHNQLTGNDDILSLEYVTGGFDSVHGFLGSYEAPLFDNDRLRWKVYGNWGTFDASEVGQTGEEFSGDDSQVGGELIWNVYQKREFFFDILAGVAWQRVGIENTTLGIASKAAEDFFLPHIGIRIEKDSGITTTKLQGMFEFNVAQVFGTDEEELEKLARIDPDDDWTVFRWDTSHSFYLEPMLDRQAWNEGKAGTLAHEIAFTFRGQHAFDKRLIPRHEDVLGGLYTVRGYPESAAAGDTTFVGGVEYRFHLPRTFPLETEPGGTLFGQPFRTAPQLPYGNADWDLILRAFLDAGYTVHSQIESFEDDTALIGAGVGVELLIKQNLSIRVDWGAALKDMEGPNGVDAGSSRWHFVATLFF